MFLTMLAAFAWLLLPGAVILRLLGLGGRLLVALAAPVTVLVLLVLSAVLTVAGIAWSPVSVGGGLLVVALGCAVTHRWSRPSFEDGGEREDGAVDPSQDRTGPARGIRLTWAAVALVSGMILGALAVVVPSLRGMGSLHALNGSYDAFFHHSALRVVRETGDAFPFTALAPMYAGEANYYPTSWHMIAALIPGDVVTASNAMLVAVLALVPVGMIALLDAVVPGRRDDVPRAVAMSAVGASSAAFLSIPTMGLVFGLWPFVLGTVLLPAGLAGAALLLRRDHGGGRRTRVALGAVVAGSVIAHPSVLFSIGVVAAAMAVAVVPRRIIAPGTRRSGLLWAVVLVGATGVAAAGVVLGLGAMAELTPPDTRHLSNTLLAMVGDRPRIRAVPFDAVPLVPLLLAALIGVVATVLRRTPVLLGAMVVILAAAVLTVSTQSDVPAFRALSAPWYGARERIHPLFELGTCVLAAAGVVQVGRWVRSRSGERARRVLAAALAVVLVAAVVVSSVAPQRLPLVGSLAYRAWGLLLTPYLTEEEREFIESSAELLPEDALVLGDPRDGTSLYWALGGVEVVYPSLTNPQTLDTRRLAAHIDVYDEAATVCESFDRVGPTHFYQDTSELSGDTIGDSQRNALWEGLRRLGQDRAVLVEVAREGDYVLYELRLPC